MEEKTTGETKSVCVDESKETCASKEDSKPQGEGPSRRVSRNSVCLEVRSNSVVFFGSLELCFSLTRFCLSF